MPVTINGSTGITSPGGDVSTSLTAGSVTTSGTNSVAALTVNSNNISAVNSLGFRNRAINGDMRIDQRNAGASVAVTGNTGQMSVDRFLLSIFGSGTGRFTAQQSTIVPTGFVNSLSATVTTADAAPSASYAYSMAQIIEGLNIADLGWGAPSASAVTLSFWIRSSVTGTFPVVINNNALTRAYGATYIINSANTWEQKTINIVGDTTGTWLTTNGIGINAQFGLGGGSSRTVSTGWQAISGTTQTNVTGCTQLIATSGATFYITGVQLEAGTVATPFERRDYGRELMMCQRYFTSSFPIGVSPQQAYNDNRCVVAYGRSNYFGHPVTMRAAPTIAFFSSNAAGGGSGTWSVFTGSWANFTPSLDNPALDKGFSVNVSNNSNTGIGSGNWTASAEL